MYEQYLTEDNYYLAVKNATVHKGGKKRKYLQAHYYRDHAEELMPKMMRYAANFKPEVHKPKLIYDGVRRKQREILVPSMREQIIHHMIINVLKPIILKSIYYHSYGSIPGRGSTSGKSSKKHHRTKGGKEAIERFIKEYPEECKYCLKMDIHKFFDSVPHSKLKDLFKSKIHDQRFLSILYTLIDSNRKDTGMPIGFYTSQWFANFYLTKLDHYIKEELHAKGYYRFMDDMVIFSNDKRSLHYMRSKINDYLISELGLSMNPKWQVFLFHNVKDGRDIGRFLDFMGFQFYRDRTVLRRVLLLRSTRKAKRIYKKGQKTIYDCRQMLSYKGWLTPTDTYNVYKCRIKPYVSFRHLCNRVSLYQKIENAERGINKCGTKMKMVI